MSAQLLTELVVELAADSTGLIWYQALSDMMRQVSSSYTCKYHSKVHLQPPHSSEHQAAIRARPHVAAPTPKL
jgi:hypothetical protein